MAQLPMESAPDAGLESLLAYAQQAARNAAAGPAPKPTWWRRWLVPAMGLAAVSVFGVVTLQVTQSVNLSAEQAVTASRMNKDEATAMAPEPPAPAMVAERAEPTAAMPASPAPMPEAAPAAAEPLAKLEANAFAKPKEASRKRATLKPSPYDADSDWSNAGAGTRQAIQEGSVAEEKSLESRGYAYDRRDARTQSGAFNKSKPMLVGQDAPATAAAPAPIAAPPQAAPPPPPAATQPGSAPADDDGADSVMNEEALATAQQEQQGTPLRLGDARRGAAGPTAGAPAADKEAEKDSFDELFGREQLARAPVVTSVSKPKKAAVGSAPKGRAEEQAQSPAELSKLAAAAMRSGDRVSEAQYLRQALEAGATGKERLGLLNRLCDAEFSIGRRQAAIEACNLVLEEDPNSSSAQVARRRLKQETPAQARPDSRLSAPKSSAPVKADDMESAPAQSY